MSQSPLEASGSDPQTDQYLENWNAVATRVREGASFSGREPNCGFLNTGAARFADVSAALGLDYPDDGRGLALCDWDQDGDVDLWLANRSSPSVRLLQNQLSGKQHYVAFLLEGTTCNRDAIGARVEVVIAGDSRARIKTLRAGEGFLSQSSKWLHFGLGKESQIDQVRVHWPGSRAPEVYRGLSADRHYRIKQGRSSAAIATARAQLRWIDTNVPADAADGKRLEAPEPSSAARTVLTQRRPLPPLSGLTTHDGSAVTWKQPDRDRPTLVVLWASWCGPCLTELTELAGHAASLEASGLDVIALNTDALTESGDMDLATRFVTQLNVPFRWLCASADVAADLTRWQHERFYRQRPLPLPCSFLLDRKGRVAVIYQGPVSANQLSADIQLLNAPGSTILQAALPHGGKNIVTWFSPDQVNLARAWLEGGYLDEAERELRQLVVAPIDPPDSTSAASQRSERVEAWRMLAQIARQRGDESAELAAWQSLVEITPDSFDDSLQWAVALARYGQADKANAVFQQLELRADDPSSTGQLNLLGQAYLQLGRLDESIAVFRRALQRNADDVECRFSLAMALQTRGDQAAAIEIYRQLLRQQPELHIAANNLAWLLAVGNGSDEASKREAAEMATRLCEATARSNASYLDTLAVALAARGQWPEAEVTLQEAIRVAYSRGESGMVEKLQKRLASFQSGRLTE